jgi:predicted dehydrogenase
MLNIRVYGTKAGLEWRQEFPNELVVKFGDQPRQTWRRGNGYICDQGKKFTRIPAGHPEGYLEAFANLYRDAAEAIASRLTGRPADPLALDFPAAVDGVAGLAFVEAAMASRAAGGSWVDIPAA